MTIKKSVWIYVNDGDPEYFLDKDARDIVDMSQGGVPKIQVTDRGIIKTFVGCPFEIQQCVEEE